MTTVRSLSKSIRLEGQLRSPGRGCDPGSTMVATRQGVLPSLAPAVCHVISARPTDCAPERACHLDGQERQRLTTLRRQSDRDRFIAGAVLVRLVLSSYLGVPPDTLSIDRTCGFCGRPHGKPVLRRTEAGLPDVRFSVSHAGDRVVAAFALDLDVGVDVEVVRLEAATEQIAALVLQWDERRELARLAPERRVAGFFTFWTRKEACAKAVGLGLTVPLSGIRVSPPAAPARLVAFPHCEDLPARMVLRDLDFGDRYAASLAIVGPCARVVMIDGSVLFA